MNKLRRRGAVLLYTLLVFLALVGLISLGVDWARVQVAQSELQVTADAAARYAAIGLNNSLNGQSAAASNAQAVVSQNKVDGSYTTLNASQDVELGTWNSTNRAFTVTTNPSSANAVRITLRRNSVRGNAIPLTFASLLGKSSADITATAIAMVDYGGKGALGANSGAYQYFIPATSNPWLSGMPKGTVANPGNPHNNPDYAGDAYTDPGYEKWKDSSGKWWTKNASGATVALDYSKKSSSPVTAGGISVTPGVSISFDGINGGANNMSSSTLYDGDGNSGWIGKNLKGAENGISNLRAPMNSVIGVFLSDSAPNSGSVPATLDFTSPSSRDFTTLQPALKQMFFIGDGRNSNGEVQRFIPPAGATRLFIGTMDEWEWNNNIGGFVVTAHQNGSVQLVK